MGLLAVAGFAAGVVAVFHDRFWWPPDDGAYAHVAERVLAGEVLNRDIQDLHAGFVNFANASAMAIFGSNLVAMRYPLAILTVVQACLIFLITLPRGTIVAVAAGTAAAALTFIQFLNPTAHWYTLFLFVTVLAVLNWMPKESWWSTMAVGFLVMTIFLFRQLTGVFVGIGVLTFLLCVAGPTYTTACQFRDRTLARGSIVIMAIGLLGYLIAKTDLAGLIMFGMGPLVILLWAIFRCDCRNSDAAAIISSLALGGLVALAPLVLYHLVNGSMLSWLDDTILAAFALSEMQFIDQASFVILFLLAVKTAIAPAGLAALINGVFWIVLVLLPPLVALITIIGLYRQDRSNGARVFLLPFLTLFYGLIAVHYQIPIYLMYTVAIFLVGLLWLAPSRRSLARAGSVGLVFFLSATGLYFQAGQPLSRGMAGVVAGTRVPVVEVSGLDRASLRIGADDAATYGQLVDLIQRETPENGTILALPVNPELYFLSGRRNPTWFFNSALGIQTEQQFQRVLELIERDPPLLVFFRSDDKYLTSYAERIMETVRIRYDPLGLRAGFEIYRYRPASTSLGRQKGYAP